jgi:hypothetical protein
MQAKKNAKVTMPSISIAGSQVVSSIGKSFQNKDNLLLSGGASH